MVNADGFKEYSPLLFFKAV